MSRRPIRGLEARHEYNERAFYRDVRPMGQKIGDFLREPVATAGVLITFAFVGMIFPAVVDLLLLTGIGLYIWIMRQPLRLPLRLPAQSGLPDLSTPHSGTGKPLPGQGILHLGVDHDDKQLFMTNDDLRRHVLLAGTTGAGKTEALLGLCANAMSMGTGFVFVDGKADRKLVGQVSAMARRYGRDDDLLFINFITGGQDLAFKKEKTLRTNTLNPFQFGSSAMVIQMLVSLMSETSGDGQQWKDMAIAMMSCGVRALVYLRDKGEFVLSVKVIREHLTFNKYLELYHRKDLPESIRGDLRAFLVGLPGLSETVLELDFQQVMAAQRVRQGNVPPIIPDKTYEQFNYRAMQFSRLLDSLASDYGHIFNTPFGDVDMWDVIVNRRILVVLLPALEKSSSELANLGKVVVANLKMMMAAAMGSEIEGEWRGLIDKRVTSAPSPVLIIFDEAGYYVVDGMAVMAAQARGLGCGLVFGTQDVPALHRLAEKEPDSVIANCNTKICMKLEDPSKTWELFKNSAGQAMVVRIRQYSSDLGAVGRAYYDGGEASMEMVDRINLQDLQAQGAGEFHLLSEGQVVRGKAFYAAPEFAVDRKHLEMGPHHLLKLPAVDTPVGAAVAVPTLAEKLASAEFAQQVQRAATQPATEPEIVRTVSRMRTAITAAKIGDVAASCLSIAGLVQDARAETEDLARAAAVRADEAQKAKADAARVDEIGAVLESETFDPSATEPVFDGGALSAPGIGGGRDFSQGFADGNGDEGSGEQSTGGGGSDELAFLDMLGIKAPDEEKPVQDQEVRPSPEEPQSQEIPITEGDVEQSAAEVRHGVSLDGTFIEMQRAVAGNSILVGALARLGAGDDHGGALPDDGGDAEDPPPPPPPLDRGAEDVVADVLANLFSTTE